MPIRKIQFENGEFYHVFNRGVEKRDIFMDERDYLRFVRNLERINDEVNIRIRNVPDVTTSGTLGKQPIVYIACFCLMPNHFHFLVKQLSDNGIINFFGRLGISYAQYFNTKYERVGSLFQGRFKAVHIGNDEQLKHTSRYIHLNPLEFIEPNWKEKGIKNWNKANNFLENYRWSSYLDYVGKENFPPVTNREFIMQYFDDKPEKYKKYIQEWVVDDLKKIDVLD